MKRVNPGLSFKVLAALAVFVLWVHLALLQGLPLTFGSMPSAPSRAFSTRAIEFPATRQPPAPARVRPAAAKPMRSKPAPTRVEPESPAAVPALSGSAGEEALPPPVSLNDDAASSRPPDAPPQEAASADADPPAAVPRPPGERPVAPKAYKVPGSVRLQYEVKGNKFPYRLSAEMVWQQDGDSYDARLAFSAGFLPVLLQTSRGKITPEGLAPLRYSDKRRSEVAAHFVREQGKIVFSANTPDAPLLADAQDRLSILLQLASMIAGDPGHYPEATTIALQTVGPRAADTWLFTVGGEETLTLPGGEQATLKLMRNPRQEFDQKVELWLAPALGYLPVRIRITETNGDFIDQQWLASEPPQ